jgi:hypothetical protein
MLGNEIAELAGKEYSSGNHIVEFDSCSFPKGVYIFDLKTDDCSSSRKMGLKNY